MKKEVALMMNSLISYLFAVLAGFGLLHAPISGSFLGSLTPVFDVIGLLSVVIFSLVLIYKGIVAFINEYVRR